MNLLATCYVPRNVLSRGKMKMGKRINLSFKEIKMQINSVVRLRERESSQHLWGHRGGAPTQGKQKRLSRELMPMFWGVCICCSSTGIILPPEHFRSGYFSSCRSQLQCYLLKETILSHLVQAGSPPLHSLSFLTTLLYLLLTSHCHLKLLCSFSLLLTVSPLA